MDAKITKTRISHMLSYDWLKIVGLVVAMIIFWNLIFRMTATKITSSQQFTVFNHEANHSFSEDFYRDLHDAIESGDTFSYEVIEESTNDLTVAGDYLSTMYTSRLGSGEGDLIFIPKIDDKNTAYQENGETKYTSDYLQSFLKNYRAYLFNLDPDEKGGYFYELKNYLNGYYTDYKKAETIDKAKIERDFIARAKANKDKRFRTEEKLALGAKQEIQRIEKYRAALVKLEGWIDEKVVQFEEVEAQSGDYYFKGKFALNICPNEESMGALKKYAAYAETTVDENGKTTTRKTAKNMCVMLFDLKETQESFEYESLLYLVHIIEECVAA